MSFQLGFNYSTRSKEPRSSMQIYVLGNAASLEIPQLQQGWRVQLAGREEPGFLFIRPWSFYFCLSSPLCTMQSLYLVFGWGQFLIAPGLTGTFTLLCWVMQSFLLFMIDVICVHIFLQFVFQGEGTIFPLCLSRMLIREHGPKQTWCLKINPAMPILQLDWHKENEIKPKIHIR